MLTNTSNSSTLNLSLGEEFFLKCYRGGKIIVNNDSSNILLQPFFQIRDVYDENITIKRTNSSEFLLKVNQNGVYEIDIYYNATIVYYGSKKTVYDACEKDREAKIILTVNEEKYSNNLKDLYLNVIDYDHDTVYFLDDIGSIDIDNGDIFSIKTKNETIIVDENKITSLPIYEGNNVFEVTTAVNVFYYVIRGKKITYESSVSDNELTLKLFGLYTPITKFPGIYNPAYPTSYGQDGSYITYNHDREMLRSIYNDQYDINQNAEFVIDLENVKSKTIYLSSGKIVMEWFGASNIGEYRNINSGLETDFSASSSSRVFSYLPEIIINI